MRKMDEIDGTKVNDTKVNDTKIDQQDNYSVQELFVESECTCCLCGHDLDFQHQIDFAEQKVLEKAQCPGCHVKRSGREHQLH